MRESPIRLEFSRKDLEEILRLESDIIRDGEGKILTIRMGIGRQGKCLVFKSTKRIILITVTPELVCESTEFEFE